MPQTEYATLCPMDYRYSHAELAQAGEHQADVLYVIGGLYGNQPALNALSLLLRAEPDAEVVFNGDFNWFNTDDHSYAAINKFVLCHSAVRGNVETELSQPVARGCGCAYPDWVERGAVDRSNEIFATLQRTALGHPKLTARLGLLPRYAVYRVGATRVGVVHGDAQSLAGWGFAQEHLSNRAHLNEVKIWFDATDIDIFACSHTCLPVLQRLERPGRGSWIVNNGSAGMPNFAGTNYGLISRLAVRPCTHVRPVYGVSQGGLYIDALPLHYDHARWVKEFLSNWGPGTPAHVSYFDRIKNGPNYRKDQAQRF